MARRHRGPLEELVGEIVRGIVAPGEALPREAALAERFGVSRGITRETMRALEERGLVRVKHGIGSTVAPRESWDSLDSVVLGALLSTERAPQLLRDFLEARRLIEIPAAGFAAERATDDDLARLDRAFEVLSDSANRAAANPAAEPRYLEADVGYHQVLMAISHNAVLEPLAGRLHAPMLEARAVLARPGLRSERTLPEHERILKAVRARDPSAARRAMKQHLDSVDEFLGEYIAEHPGGETRAA